MSRTRERRRPTSRLKQGRDQFGRRGLHGGHPYPQGGGEVGRRHVVEEYARAITEGDGGDQHFIAQLAVGELGLDVAPREQAGDADAMSEPVVDDRREARAQSLDPEAGEERRHPRGVQLPRDHGHLAPSFDAGRDTTKAAPEAIFESPHQPDAVFGHGEALVGRGRRERPAGLQIQLVSSEDEPSTERPQELSLPALDVGHHGPRFRLRHRPQRGQPLPVAREPHRNDRRRRHTRMQSRQVAHGVLQVRAVVPVGDEDDLGVHGDACLGEPLHDGQELAPDVGTAEQTVAELGIGGMHRDIEWREPLLLDPCEVVLLEVGEGNVIAVEEGEPEIVVLDVEAPPHPPWQLVDEAEDALIGAGRDLRGPGRLELEAEPGGAALEHEAALPPVSLDRETEALLSAVELEVDAVTQRMAVDGQDSVAGAQLAPLRGAS